MTSFKALGWRLATVFPLLTVRLETKLKSTGQIYVRLPIIHLELAGCIACSIWLLAPACMMALLSSRRGIWGHAAAARTLIKSRLLQHRPFSLPKCFSSHSLHSHFQSIPSPLFVSRFLHPVATRLSHLHPPLYVNYHPIINKIILPTDGLTGSKTWLLLANGHQGTEIIHRCWGGIISSMSSRFHTQCRVQLCIWPVTKVTAGNILSTLGW